MGLTQSVYAYKTKISIFGARCVRTTLWHCVVENKSREDFFYKLIMFLSFSFLGPTIYDVAFVILISTYDASVMLVTTFLKF